MLRTPPGAGLSPDALAADSQPHRRKGGHRGRQLPVAGSRYGTALNAVLILLETSVRSCHSSPYAPLSQLSRYESR